MSSSTVESNNNNNSTTEQTQGQQQQQQGQLPTDQSAPAGEQKQITQNNTQVATPNSPIQEIKQNRNPITSEELNAKIKQISEDKEKFNRFQEQLAIKFRTEMQNYKYTPTEEFKDHPNLQPTDVDSQLEQSPNSKPNSEIGEVSINQEQQQTPKKTLDQVSAEQAQQAANQQEQPSKSLKG